MPYLAVRSGNYFLRLAVPKSLQPLLGQAEIFQNLNTSDRQQARILALSVTAELLLKFSEWKGNLKKKNEAGDGIETIGIFDARGIPQVKPPASTKPVAVEVNATQYNLDVMPNGQPYIKYSDPANPQDHANALQALERAEQAAAKSVAAPAAPTPSPAAQNAPQLTQKALEAVAKEAAKQARDEVAGVVEKLQGIKPRNIHGAFTDFVEQMKADKLVSLRHYQSGVKHFIDWLTPQHPNIQVHKVSEEHMAEYRKLLENLRSHKGEKKKLHPHNIYKRMGFVEKFFRFCQSKKWMRDGDTNLPTFGLKGKKPDYEAGDGESYEMFTQGELQRLFDPKTYAANFEAPHLFWTPLLAAFTGMRRGEISNLHPDDINTENPDKVWVVSIKRKVKNKKSRRIIPLHSKLIELGFLEYLEDLRKIFPKAEIIFPYTWNMNKYVGEGFAAYADVAGVTSPLKVLHSFRKNVANTLLMAGLVEEKYREHFVGHLSYKLHESVYSGKANPMKFYSGLVNEYLKYDIDFNALKYQRGMFDKMLTIEKLEQDRKAKFASRRMKSAAKN